MIARSATARDPIRAVIVALCLCPMSHGCYQSRPLDGEDASTSPATWEKAYSYGNSWDDSVSIQQTSEGNYIVAAGSAGGSLNFSVLLIDGEGRTLWMKTVPEPYGEKDYARLVRQVSDGGFIVAGSYGDMMKVVKIDANGRLEWSRKLTSSYLPSLGQGGPHGIDELRNVGYILTGLKRKEENPFQSEIIVTTIDNYGSGYWETSLEVPQPDRASAVLQAGDGGFYLAGDMVSSGGSGMDVLVARWGSAIDLMWQKSCGGAGDDYAFSALLEPDGGVIVGGKSSSFGPGDFDGWALGLDHEGNLIWQKQYRSANWEGIHHISATADGGFVAAGYSSSSDYEGDRDFWILRCDSDGSILWQRAYGGPMRDEAYSVQETEDGGYILAGRTESFGSAGYDTWVLKLDEAGSMSAECSEINGRATEASAIETNASVVRVDHAPGTGNPSWTSSINDTEARTPAVRSICGD